LASLLKLKDVNIISDASSSLSFSC